MRHYRPLPAVVFAVLTDNSLWENSSQFTGGWALLSPGGTAMTRPLRCRCTSKPAGSAEVELSVTASVLLLPNALQGVAEIGAESGFHMRAAEIDP